MRCSALLLLLTCLAGCCFGGREHPEWSRARAEADTTPRNLRVLAVHEARDIDDGADPGLSHYIRVEVLAGPDTGQELLLPYDTWKVAQQPPPAIGATLVASPSDWVRYQQRLPGAR